MHIKSFSAKGVFDNLFVFLKKQFLRVVFKNDSLVLKHKILFGNSKMKNNFPNLFSL